MNLFTTLLVFVTLEIARAGYVKIGDGHCIDSGNAMYSRIIGQGSLSVDACEDKCENYSTDGLVGFEFFGNDCYCLYTSEEEGTGPIVSFETSAGSTCYKYIGANTLEFVGDGADMYNSSTSTLTLDVAMGDNYNNDTFFYEPVVKMWEINNSLPLNEIACKEEGIEASNVAISGGLVDVTSSDSSGMKSQEISLNLTGLEDSNIYFNTSDTEGEIKFCTRIDVFEKGTEKNFSVAFAETVITLGVNKTAGFVIKDIDAKRDSPTTQDTDAKFEVEACICGDDNGCEEDPVLSQNSPYSLCLRAKSQGLSVSDVLQVDVIQGDEVKHSPVKNNVLNALAREEEIAKGIKINTRVMSSFYPTTSPENLKITGTVLLGFGDGGRRFLSENVFSEGPEEDENVDATFELNVGLKPLSDLEETVTTIDDGEEGDKDDAVVVEGQEDDKNEGNDGQNTISLNVIIGVGAAVLCTLVLVVGFRRSGSRTDSGVVLKYDNVENSV